MFLGVHGIGAVVVEPLIEVWSRLQLSAIN